MSYQRSQFRKRSGRTPDILRKSHRHETEAERRTRRYRKELAKLAAMEDDFEDDDDDRSQGL